MLQLYFRHSHQILSRYLHSRVSFDLHHQSLVRKYDLQNGKYLDVDAQRFQTFSMCLFRNRDVVFTFVLAILKPLYFLPSLIRTFSPTYRTPLPL